MCPVVHNDKFLIQDLVDHHGMQILRWANMYVS